MRSSLIKGFAQRNSQLFNLMTVTKEASHKHLESNWAGLAPLLMRPELKRANREKCSVVSPKIYVSLRSYRIKKLSVSLSL